jgi:hypothetical protein
VFNNGLSYTSFEIARRTRAHIGVAAQERAPAPIGVVGSEPRERPHQVVLGLDVDEEIPRSAAERGRVLRQRRQRRHAPLPFDVVNGGGIFRVQSIGEREHGLAGPFPQVPPQLAKPLAVRHVALMVPL